MWAIWKFELNGPEIITIKMPSTAHILKVATQNGMPCIWALVNVEAKLVTRKRVMRTFRIFGTGHDIPGGPLITSENSIEIQQKYGMLKYIDTFFSLNNNALVWHLFEVISDA